MKGGLLGELAVVVAAVALYLFLSYQHLELPGLYYDEALDAVPAMQLLLGQDELLDPLRGSGLELWGRTYPLMILDYMGTVNTYLVLPFFALLGVNVTALRSAPILGGALTLVLSYLLGRRLFDRWVAGVTILLLAVHPSFIFWHRQGFHVTSIMTVFSTGGLLALLQGYQRRSLPWLLLGAFLLGLGLSAKLLFLWFVMGLIIAACLVGLLKRGVHLPWRQALAPRLTPLGGAEGPGAAPLAWGQPRRSPSPLWWLGAGLAMLGALVAGAGALVLYNLQTQGTWLVVTENLTRSRYGVSNLDFLANLLVRLDSFQTILHGGHFWFLGNLFFNRLYPPLVFASLLGLGILLWLRPNRRFGIPSLFLIFLLGTILVQSTVTLSDLAPPHLFILYPLPQLLVGAFVLALARAFPWRWAGVVLALIIVGSLFFVDLGNDLQYHRVLRETGGKGLHSDVVYQLADYLVRQGATKPVAMDWGIETSVQILTKGRVNPLELYLYGEKPPDFFYDWLYGALTKMDTLYVFHSDNFTVYPRFALFKAFAAKLGMRVVERQRFAQPDGNVVYRVYAVER